MKISGKAFNPIGLWRQEQWAVAHCVWAAVWELWRPGSDGPGKTAQKTNCGLPPQQVCVGRGHGLDPFVLAGFHVHEAWERVR